MTDEVKPKEPASQAEAGTEDEGKPDLDSLLASYGKEGGKETKPKGGELTALDEIKALRAENAERDYREAMDDIVIPALKSEVDAPDDYIEYWANKQAEADDRLLELWDSRKKNPTGFKEAISALGKKFAEDVGDRFGKPTEDGSRKLASTVRSSRESKGSPADGFDDVNWQGLGDQDFELKKRELFRAVEQGAVT